MQWLGPALRALGGLVGAVSSYEVLGIAPMSLPQFPFWLAGWLCKRISTHRFDSNVHQHSLHTPSSNHNGSSHP